MDNITVIISVGTIIWTLISGLLVYIWRSDRKALADRLDKIENDKEISMRELLNNPVLTISSHSIICTDVWKHLTEKLTDLEKGINLAIRNAVLEALRFAHKRL